MVCYLSPLSIAEYLDVGVLRHFEAVCEANVAEANQRMVNVLEKTDGRQLNFDSMTYVKR